MQASCNASAPGNAAVTAALHELLQRPQRCGVVRLRDVFIDVSMFRDIGCVCNAMRVRGIAELHRCGRGRLDQRLSPIEGQRCHHPQPQYRENPWDPEPFWGFDRWQAG
ncbi:hypothetical protein XHV734_4207 [Xanthomonas hortorum pv. vitians]|nr:hypothetical protein XHV734_4207 [Xanthomonas hortorum pv. vitians]